MSVVATTLSFMQVGNLTAWRSNCGDYEIRLGRHTGQFLALRNEWSGSRDLGSFPTFGEAVGRCRKDFAARV